MSKGKLPLPKPPLRRYLVIVLACFAWSALFACAIWWYAASIAPSSPAVQTDKSASPRPGGDSGFAADRAFAESIRQENRDPARAARSIKLAPISLSPAAAISSNAAKTPAAGKLSAAQQAAALMPVTIANAAAAAPDTVSIESGAFNNTATPAEIAMRPSLKYAKYLIGVTATTVPSTPANPSTGKIAKPYDIHLIQEAIRLEDARKFTMSMCMDLNGCLWVGTEDGGVQRFNPSAPELKQWTQFTTKDGLGDDNGYAIACDKLGRIWVGHLNHGVSVYNGEKWQNYEVVGGISSPESLSGPLGERIFAIKVCPTNGDVWIASNRGLSRYSDSGDSWSYITRLDGIPSDEVQAIAFDANGDVYLGTQCNGIAISRATDSYRRWQVISGPTIIPSVGAGDGLPGNLINDMLVKPDGTVYAATTSGLAWSKDRGTHWHYVRGKDWVDKLKGRYSGPSSDWKPTGNQVSVAEDYVTSLADGGEDAIWIGYRQHGHQLVDVIKGRIIQGSPNSDFITCLLLCEDKLFVGTYGDEPVGDSVSYKAFSEVARTIPLTTRRMPASAVPTNKELEQLPQIISSAYKDNDDDRVVALSDDWRTQGDWLGRYGRYISILLGADFPFDIFWGVGKPATRSQCLQNLDYQMRIGANHLAGDALRRWCYSMATESRSSLEIPPAINATRRFGSSRRQTNCDDHGEAYPLSHEGPDIEMRFYVPFGLHKLSLYFVNDDGHGGRMNRLRDYLIEISTSFSTDSVESPVLARERVLNFNGGVYKRFAVRGPRYVNVRVRRNGSLNTILSGVFLDTFDVMIYPYQKVTDNTPSAGSSRRSASPTQYLDSEMATADIAFDRVMGFCENSGRSMAYASGAFVELARSYQISKSKHENERRRLADCLFRLDAYEECERLERAAGIVPPRDIEESLEFKKTNKIEPLTDLRLVEHFVAERIIGPTDQNQ